MVTKLSTAKLTPLRETSDIRASDPSRRMLAHPPQDEGMEGTRPTLGPGPAPRHFMPRSIRDDNESLVTSYKKLVSSSAGRSPGRGSIPECPRTIRMVVHVLRYGSPNLDFLIPKHLLILRKARRACREGSEAPISANRPSRRGFAAPQGEARVCRWTTATYLRRGLLWSARA